MSEFADSFIDQSIPYAEDAEEAILAVMFKDRETIADISHLVRAEDFYKQENAILYKTLVSLDENGQPIDLITVNESLRKDNLLEKVGGTFRIGQIADAPGITFNAKDYAKIVREKSILRELIQATNRVRNQCYEDAEPIEKILDKAEQSILDISKQRQRNDLVRIEDIVETNLNMIEEASTHTDSITGTPSGFIDLDRMTNGWQKSDLIILAARPAMGKTALCLNMAANAAVDHHRPVAIFSLEMSKEQLVQRMLSSAARIDQKRLRTGQLNADEWSAFMQKIGPISDAPIYIDDTPAITIRELRAKARRLQSREPELGLILLDYLQLMGGSGSSENRQQEVSEISRSLKALARELEVPIIALSQLSRSVEATKDKRPQLSHLRESGSLEQDADLVLFIFREEYYDENTDRQGIADVIIAKHRNGPTGTVELAFQSELTKFENLVQDMGYMP